MRIFLLCFLLSANLALFAQRECASRHYLESQLSDISIVESISSADKFISAQKPVKESQQSNTKAAQDANSTELIRIPVVVHIVYNTSSQNISDDQVRSQIEALNRDFRRRNADTTNTPQRFRSSAADIAIDFFLATADPYGGPTNGIVRRQTNVVDWNGDDKIKFTSQGGSNAWDSRSYLNIWVGNLRRITGYSSAPGSPAERDGIVISYNAFGSNGSAPYHMGRTAVHEAGHWLGLKHIWGDNYCGDDGVDDTPQQGNFTPGCPAGFRTSCNNGTNGDMYMNYMDFTYDACINLFTTGQKNRMRSCFNEGGPRYSLLSSKGLDKPWTSGKPVEEAVVIIETKPEITLYPNPATSVLKINFEGENSPGNEIRIINMYGITVMRFSRGSNAQRINISSLPAGNYMLVMDSGQKLQSKGFVKL
jgi:hypothetical protein